MAASPSPTPTISLTLSVTPTSYSFTDPHPPTLSITLLSHSPSPVTLFTFFTPLDPASGLDQDAFLLTDLSSSPPLSIPQDSIRLQRLPSSRERGGGDDKYFLTLYPEPPLTVSADFATGGGEGWRRPQPRHVVRRGRVLDEYGNLTSARSGTIGNGVNGLKSGKRYRVEVNRDMLDGIWWKWGEREEIMVERGDREWSLDGVVQG